MIKIDTSYEDFTAKRYARTGDVPVPDDVVCEDQHGVLHNLATKGQSVSYDVAVALGIIKEVPQSVFQYTDQFSPPKEKAPEVKEGAKAKKLETK